MLKQADPKINEETCRLILTVPLCAIVMEIESKGTFMQLVSLKVGMGMLYPMRAVFQNVSFRPKSSASVYCNIPDLFWHI